MPHHCQMDYYRPGIIRMHILVVLKDSVVVKRRTGAIHRPKKDIVKKTVADETLKAADSFLPPPARRKTLTD